MSVASWAQALDDDPILVSVSDPSVKKTGLFGSTKRTYYTTRTSSRASLLSVAREYKDFVLLHKTLASRLRGACLPPVPPEKILGAGSDEFISKRMHLLEAFLQTIVDNPYTRTDSSTKLFLSSEDAFDKALKGTDGQESEGQRMWRQALDEATNAPSDEEVAGLLDKLNRELDVILKSLNQLKDAAKAQVAALKKFAEASAQTAHAFEAWQVREESSVLTLRGVATRVDGSKTVLVHELRDLARDAHAYAAVLELEYSASQLEAIVVDAIRFEIAQAERWKAQVAEVQAKIRLDRKAGEHAREAQNQAAAKPNDVKAQNRVKELLRIEEEAKAESRDLKRGLFCVELERYRKQRAVRVETVRALLARAHVRGANMIKGAWDGSGSTPAPRPSSLMLSSAQTAAGGGGSFALFRRKSLERTPSGHLRARKAGDAEAVQAELSREAQATAPRALAIQSDANKTVLKAKKRYEAKKKDELDLVEGETVTAVRIDDDLWYATNAQGKSGLVPSSHVGVPLVSSADDPVAPSIVASPSGSVAGGDADGAAGDDAEDGAAAAASASPGAPPPGLGLPPGGGAPPPPPPSRDPGHAPPLPDASEFDYPVGGGAASPPFASDASKRMSVAPRPPHVPDFLLKRGEQDLPPLPSNAEALAALRAKLATLHE